MTLENQEKNQQKISQKNQKDESKADTTNIIHKPDDEPALPLLVLNDLLKVPLRFNVMFLLYSYDRLGFTRLQKLLHSTPGNLDHHLKKLIAAGWVVDTIIFSPRPLKIFKITQSGKDEFSDYVQHLQKIIKNFK